MTNMVQVPEVQKAFRRICERVGLGDRAYILAMELREVGEGRPDAVQESHMLALQRANLIEYNSGFRLTSPGQKHYQVLQPWYEALP